MATKAKNVIHIIVAMDANKGIGLQDDNMYRLPFNVPEDMRYFKACTWGNPVIMGRHTFESLPAPLPGRRNIVLSKTQKGIPFVQNFEEALQRAHAWQCRDIFVIGGRTIYELALPIANELHITTITAQCGANIFFPAIDFSEWELKWSEERARTASRPYNLTFTSWQRK